ncbi:MAG: hypothetical protein ABEJ34_02595 [Haloferacaceae archaeon]
MVGVTLADIRDHVESLASDDGPYYVACGRTGDRPVPVARKRFDDRATARSAVRATEQYRTALRRYDPQLPRYDLIVVQDPPPSTGAERSRGLPDPSGRTPRGPGTDGTPSGGSRRRLVEFAHRVAGAAFETLSDAGYDAVETAVMDAYLGHAESTATPDDLCLCLLESMATELDGRLSPAEQTEVLAGTADRLPPIEPDDRPLAATLSALEARGLLEGHTRSPWSLDLDDGTRSVLLRLSGYALSPRNDRLPVLPIVVELHRHRPDWSPTALRATPVDGGWHLTLVRARTVEPDGLVSAPIRSGA